MNPDPFKLISDAKNYASVLEILRQRLPHDANVFNMALLSRKHPDNANIYAWDEEIGIDLKPNSTWIVITSIREDNGKDIGISTPPESKLNESIKKILTNSKIFGWNEPHIFVALRPSVATMITEIELRVKHNKIYVCPCYLYYKDPFDAWNFDPMLKPGVTIKSLDAEAGADFICRNWRYATNGSLEYMQRFMKINSSRGVFLRTAEKNDEELVSGIVLPNNGLMGMLFTKKNHRSHQYGTLAMQSLMKEISMQGLVPCSAVNSCNEGSQLFHAKVEKRNYYWNSFPSG